MSSNHLLLSNLRNTAAVQATESLLFKMSYAGKRLMRSAITPIGPVLLSEVSTSRHLSSNATSG